ncbi:MAG: PIN domain-containing protein [Desertimonas sp.]
MTVALDTTALLAVVTAGPGRALTLDALDGDPVWAAAASALAEALAAIDRLTDETVLRADLEDGVRRLWDHLHVVPLDTRALERAATLARQQPLPVAHGLHLAAAERMPAPVRFVTFDPTQIAVALSVGFDVVSA